jgi:glucose/arabinose dehydrogenase
MHDRWAFIPPTSRRHANAMVALVAGLVACGDGPTMDAPPGDPGPSGFTVEEVVDGLESPVHLTFAPGPEGTRDRRLFVVEQPGRIRVVRVDGTLRPTPFLDITDRVGCCGERGLLSVAFHPDYAVTGWIFVNYTDKGGQTRVERYSVSNDPDVADPLSAELVLQVAQPFANHNGGLNLFGPDGMLYVGLGDGGSGGDPQGNGQNRGTLLGSILRLDVDQGLPYTVPEDNPFVGTVNFGWNIMEGRHCYGSGNCNQNGLTLPIAEYSHADGCSVTGGYVYRGSALPALTGHYFFADYCDGQVWSLEPGPGSEPSVRSWSLGDLGRITSFGEDAEGELYILSVGGSVYRLVPGEPPAG